MPVIPYTLRIASLWREFSAHNTLSTHHKGTMKRSTLITVAVIALILGLFFYMSTARANEECRVCMEFQGRSNCAAAAGRTPAEATETAHNTACGPIVSGMNETIACGNREPVSVQCRNRNS
jgi:hypothetical protein